MKSKIKVVIFFMFLFMVMGTQPLLKADNSGIELVGQWDETAVNKVFIEGNTAYISSGKRLIILDISNKAQPKKPGEISVEFEVTSIDVSGDYVYITAGDSSNIAWISGWLYVIDQSIPGSPMEVASYKMKYPAQSVVVSGKYAYVGTGIRYLSGGFGRMEIFDISNPTSPQLKGSLDTSNVITAVYVSGNYAYYAFVHQASVWSWGGMEIIDISLPASPRAVGSRSFVCSSGAARSIHVSKGHAYVADYCAYKGGSIKILNVSNPNSPQVGYRYETPGTAEDVFISGNYAYIADGKGGLRIANISKPYGPYEVAFYETPGEAQAVHAAGGYVYVADDTGGLLVLKPSSAVLNQPLIDLEKTQLYFGAVRGTSVATGPQDVRIRNRGGGTLNWHASTSTNWLNVSPQSGTGGSLASISINPNGLPVGSYTGTVTINDVSASNNPQAITVDLTVYKPGKSPSPFGYFETPPDSSTVMSSVPVTGWVLHDIGVDSVQIYRKTIPGEGKGRVYIGDAIFVEGARPDVEATFPGYPLNSRAGWGYMLLTNFLPNGGNGKFTLYAEVTTMDGQQFTLGTKTVICDNANAVKPFGALDTPTQGGSASGSAFINWGWVLTPQPNSISTEGSSITVYVDGLILGHPTYNIYRPDIATLFPGYANSDGAAGYFFLDTTPYANGIHTIQWTAYDSAWNTDGIGSRYFMINNTGDSTTRKRETANPQVPKFDTHHIDFSGIPLYNSEPMEFTKGYQRNAVPQTAYPDHNGLITIEIKELERLEIHLEGTRGLAPLSDYTGYLVVGDQLKTLPVGSHLDSEKGVFSWGAGPGFVGNYQLVFVNSNGQLLRRVNIKIRPKYQ
ncbi:MAG: hypothetical protein PVH61_09300 [Candidatus Aminicenantes bacterium]|jgi:hypothetical protein